MMDLDLLKSMNIELKKAPLKDPKQLYRNVIYWYYLSILVEAAGIEPASENLPLELLRA